MRYHYIMNNGDDMTMIYDQIRSRYEVRQQSHVNCRIYTRFFDNIGDANRAYNRGII